MWILGLLCLLLALCGVVLLILFGLQRRELKSVAQLSAQLQGIASGGRLPARLDLPGDTAEVAGLVSAVNQLLTRAGGGTPGDAAVQAPLNKLTESARGENKQQQADDPDTALSDLKGHISVKNGIATLSNVSFNAPGTYAQIRGTYNLLTHAVNLQGILRTNGKLSDTTSGFKAVVLKAVSPLLKKKTVTVVPFSITGTSMQPSFGLDLAAKRTF